MGTISSIASTFQLSSLLSSSSGASSLNNASTASGLTSLAQALNAVDSSSSQSGSSAYLLDLSPQAQQLLSGNTSSGSGSSGNFTLTAAQQATIKTILEKYKSAPFDQATFDSIQNDLQAAGLSPQTLAAQDQVNSFNPTNDLLSALNGNYGTIQSPAASAANEQNKQTAYLQSIISLWKSESTTASSASGSAVTA